MTVKEKEYINEIKSTDMSQDEMCTKRFMFCAYNKLAARHRNMNDVPIDRKTFAADVNKFLMMNRDELCIYELGVNETDLEKRGEHIIKNIFERFNL